MCIGIDVRLRTTIDSDAMLEFFLNRKTLGKSSCKEMLSNILRLSDKSSQIMVWYARSVFSKDVHNNDNTFTNIEKFS